MSMQQRLVRVGIAGLGGYAGSVRNHIMRCVQDEKFGPPGIHLTAVCEPDQRTHARTIEELRARGVTVYENIDQLLGHDLEAVWLPVPIDLHRLFTEKALAAGKVVMCEKPAAGCVQDVDAMIAARNQARLPVGLGFQHIYDELTLPAKRKLLEGAIGEVRSATLWGCWPRGDKYYGRASWAGALKRNGVWVLDSPATNAMAHYINLGLFLLGSTLEASAPPHAVEAELYRARAIENCDTLSLRLHLGKDVPFLVMMTHACARNIDPRMVVHGTRGRMHWEQAGGVKFEDLDGNIIETWAGTSKTMHRRMVLKWAQLTVGVSDPDIALADLEGARAHLVAVNGAAEAIAVRSVPESMVQTVLLKDDPVRSIVDIETLFAQCAQQQRMIHESGLAGWSQPAGRKDLTNYTHFAGPKMD